MIEGPALPGLRNMCRRNHAAFLWRCYGYGYGDALPVLGYGVGGCFAAALGGVGPGPLRGLWDDRCGIAAVGCGDGDLLTGPVALWLLRLRPARLRRLSGGSSAPEQGEGSAGALLAALRGLWRRVGARTGTEDGARPCGAVAGRCGWPLGCWGGDALIRGTRPLGDAGEAAGALGPARGHRAQAVVICGAALGHGAGHGRSVPRLRPAAGLPGPWRRLDGGQAWPGGEPGPSICRALPWGGWGRPEEPAQRGKHPYNQTEPKPSKGKINIPRIYNCIDAARDVLL